MTATRDELLQEGRELFDLVHRQAVAEGRVEEFIGPDGKTWIRRTEKGRADHERRQAERKRESTMTTTFPGIPTNPESWLPISSGGKEHCHGCGQRVETHHVIDPWSHWRPVCRPCIAALPGRGALHEWADLADIYNQIDRFFEDVPNVKQRQVFLDLIAGHASWMANWRWHDDKVISIQPPLPDDDNLDDEDEA